jgi:hypothetical protein
MIPAFRVVVISIEDGPRQRPFMRIVVDLRLMSTGTLP